LIKIDKISLRPDKNGFTGQIEWFREQDLACEL